MAKKQKLNYNDDDDFFNDRRKKNRPLKHSRNIPGQGMRVINTFAEDDDGDIFGTYEDYDDNAYTSVTQR